MGAVRLRTASSGGYLENLIDIVNGRVVFVVSVDPLDPSGQKILLRETSDGCLSLAKVNLPG